MLSDHSHIFDLSHLQSTQTNGPPYAQYTFCQYFLKNPLASFWRNYKTKFWLSFYFLYNLKWAWSWNKLKWNPLLCLGVRPYFWNKTPRSTVLPFWSRIQELYISDNYAALNYALVLIINNSYVFFLWICVPYIFGPKFIFF